MLLVKIMPKSKRAFNRVNEHGATMVLIEEGTYNGIPAIRVQSTKETFGSEGRKDNWSGWFDENEASWDIHEAEQFRETRSL